MSEALTIVATIMGVIAAILGGIWAYARLVVAPYVLSQVQARYVELDRCISRHAGDTRVDAKINTLETQVAEVKGDLKAIMNDLQWIRSTLERERK